MHLHARPAPPQGLRHGAPRSGLSGIKGRPQPGDLLRKLQFQLDLLLPRVYVMNGSP